jgi:hypothetical protein
MNFLQTKLGMLGSIFNDPKILKFTNSEIQALRVLALHTCPILNVILTDK